MKRVMSHLAHGYLKLVHRIEGGRGAAPQLDRATGGSTVWDRRRPRPPTEDEISDSSEERPANAVGFVDLFRRSLHYEKMGLPLTALELYSMEYLERRKQRSGAAGRTVRMPGGYLDEGRLERRAGGRPETTPALPQRGGFDNKKPAHHRPSEASKTLEALEASECRNVALRRKSSERVTAGGMAGPEISFQPRRVSQTGQASRPANGDTFLKIFSQPETEHKRIAHHQIPIRGSLPAPKDMEACEQRVPKHQAYKHCPGKYQCQGAYRSKDIRHDIKDLKDIKDEHDYSRSVSPEPVLNCRYAKMNIREADGMGEVVAPSPSPPQPTLPPPPPRYQVRNSPVSQVMKVLVAPRNIKYSEEALAERWKRESLSKPSCSKDAPPGDCRSSHSSSAGSSKDPMRSVRVLLKTTPRRHGTTRMCESGASEQDLKVASRSSSPGMSLFTTKTESSEELELEDLDGEPVADGGMPMPPDILTEVWERPVRYCAEPPSHGLYRLGEALKYQPIDRLDAGCLKTPLFEAEDDVERTRYFVNEFAKLTLEEQRQDIEFRLGQLRLLQDTSDREYRRHILAQGFVVKPIMNQGEKYPCPFGQDQCPLVTNDHLLGHYLRDHSEPGIQVRESFEENRLLIIFNPMSMDLGHNACMSVMVYGGVRGRPCTMPIRRFMPSANKDLPKSFACYEGHLPLFVMICRNRRSHLESGRKVHFQDATDSESTVAAAAAAAAGAEESEDDDSDVLTLWMASVDLPQPIYAVMTVFNRRLDASVSSILKVRGLRKSHDCRVFMQSSRHFMRLGGKDLKILTNNNTEPLYLEVTIKEYVGLFPLQNHSCKAHHHHHQYQYHHHNNNNHNRHHRSPTPDWYPPHHRK